MSLLPTCTFFQSKLVLIMISLGERLPDIPFFMGKAFSHRTQKYNMLVIRNLWRYLNGIVVKVHGLLYLNVRIVLSISENIYFAAEVFTITLSIKSSIVL